MACVYVLKNLNTGKHYVGQTKKTARARLNEHVNNAKAAKPKMLISRSIKKHGKEKFFIIEECICEEDKLDALEAQLIDAYDSLQPNGYNILKFGQVSQVPGGYWRGKERDPETLRKLQEGARKYYEEHGCPTKGVPMKEEQKTKLLAGAKAWRENLTEEEWRAFIERGAKKRIGHITSEETRAKISAANKGRSPAEHTIRAAAAKNSTRTRSEEERAKRIASLTGLKRSDEIKEMYTEIQRAKVPAETKEKILKCKQMILDGYSNKDIAESLGMTYEYVRKIRKDTGGKSVPWPQPYTPNKAWERLKDKLQ